MISDFNLNPKLKHDTMQLAQKSLLVEKDKFLEALLTVIKQKVVEFLKKEMGYVQEKKVTKIESLSEYEFIIEDNLQEFYILYS